MGSSDKGIIKARVEVGVEVRVKARVEAGVEVVIKATRIKGNSDVVFRATARSILLSESVTVLRF